MSNERADRNHTRAADDHDTANEDHDTLIVISTQVSQIKEVIDKMDRKLMGNGKEGLCVTVLKQGQEILSMKEQREKVNRNTITAVSIIVSIAMLVVAIIKII